MDDFEKGLYSIGGFLIILLVSSLALMGYGAYLRQGGGTLEYEENFGLIADFDVSAGHPTLCSVEFESGEKRVLDGAYICSELKRGAHVVKTMRSGLLGLSTSFIEVRE